MKLKQFILAAAFAAFFSPIANATKPYSTTIPLRVLCSSSAEFLMLELFRKYNEVPVYSIQLEVDRPQNITMVVTENKNNPSSSFILINPNIGPGVACIFFTAKDTLLNNGAESLEKKVPKQGATDT